MFNKKWNCAIAAGFMMLAPCALAGGVVNEAGLCAASALGTDGAAGFAGLASVVIHVAAAPEYLAGGNPDDVIDPFLQGPNQKVSELALKTADHCAATYRLSKADISSAADKVASWADADGSAATGAAVSASSIK